MTDALKEAEDKIKELEILINDVADVLGGSIDLTYVLGALSEALRNRSLPLWLKNLK